MKFPRLFKKTQTGAIQFWDISTEGATIVTTYGQVGGAEQTTTDTVREGKNLGKANATSPEQQAELEAKSKWTRQVERKGYVKDQSKAAAGENEHEDTGEVMLAKKYFDQESHLTKLEDGHHIKFPALFQPKLDGIRCKAVLRNGECRLWSRTHKEFISVPHINSAYESFFGRQNIELDGELYSASRPDDLEWIAHVVGQKKEPCEGFEEIQHFLYDLPGHPGTNEERSNQIWKYFEAGLGSHDAPFVRVETIVVANQEEMLAAFRHYRDLGYEGGIVRNRHAKYEGKRSKHLQKVVEHITGEFPITGIEEGSGKLQGHVGAFWMTFTNGEPFKAKLEGDTGRLKEYFEHPELWQGKKMTVRYRCLTRKNKVPKFPVALCIRDYE